MPPKDSPKFTTRQEAQVQSTTPILSDQLALLLTEILETSKDISVISDEHSKKFQKLLSRARVLVRDYTDGRC